MAEWLNFPFDPEIFALNWKEREDTDKLAIVQSGAMVEDPAIAALIANGSDTYTVPFYSVLADDEDQNYDGKTDIALTEAKGESETGIVFGRAHGFKETEFVRDFNSGANPMAYTAAKTYEWWQRKEQQRLVGITMAALTSKGMESHVVSAADTTEATVGDAIASVFGDQRDKITLAIMHSKVCRKLEQLQLLEYKKYTDAQGIESRTHIAQLEGGVTVIEYDGVPTTDASGDTKATYTTLLYTPGALRHANAPVTTPAEVFRDPITNGGINELLMRRRETIHPEGFSFKKPATGYTASPTDAQLFNKANWAPVADPKTIGLAALVHTLD